MATQASMNIGGGAVAPEKFTDAVAVEKESENLVQSGKDGFGQRIYPYKPSRSSTACPGLYPTTSSNTVIRWRRRPTRRRSSQL